MRDEEDIARRAVAAWSDIDGDDELAEARREALVAIAREALAQTERRDARERHEAEARRAAERERKWAERALDEQRAARHEARFVSEARARDARLAAVERAQARRRDEETRRQADPRRREERPLDEDARPGAEDVRGNLRALTDAQREDLAPESVPLSDDAGSETADTAAATPYDPWPRSPGRTSPLGARATGLRSRPPPTASAYARARCRRGRAAAAPCSGRLYWRRLQRSWPQRLHPRRWGRNIPWEYLAYSVFLAHEQDMIRLR